ncbi:hypothetical protein ACFX1Z_024189 [Malus domestica]
MAKHSSFLSSPMMFIEKGKSNAASKVMCKIVWTIEGDLEAGQFLYITGDPTVLGCWEPGIAILMSPTEHTNLWKAEVKPPGFGLTVRTVAAGHSLEELQKDLEGLVSTWKSITEHAKSAALAADEGVEGAIPVILQRGNGSLSVVQDSFIETVEKMVVDSPRTYHEVSNYLQEIAPDLCDRVEVPLANGGSLVIEQTEALVSIDVNGGLGMFGHGNSQEKAILEVNLAAAKQIAREL